MKYLRPLSASVLLVLALLVIGKDARAADALEGKLVDYTWWLVAVGIVQFCTFVAQAILLGVTIRRARLSERSWVSIELGYIRGMKELGDFRIDPARLIQQPDLIMRPLARYSWINSGKTPARIIEARLEFTTVVEKDLPAEPVYGPAKIHPILLTPGRPMRTQAVLILDVRYNQQVWK